VLIVGVCTRPQPSSTRRSSCLTTLRHGRLYQHSSRQLQHPKEALGVSPGEPACTGQSLLWVGGQVYDIYSGLKKDTHADVLAMAIRKLQEFRFKLTVATFLCACFEALLS